MIRVTLKSIGPWVMLLAFIAGPSQSLAQLSPEIGFMLPSGAKAGTTVDVVIGGYDWTPDMQILVHDPRIKLELLGKSTGVLITEPPYWFGYKARGYAWPLSREFPARLTIPADVPPGLVRWQVANANGASPVAQFYVGDLPEVAEDPKRKGAQQLPTLPVTVTGQIRRIEEIDRYQFSVSKTGPVTIEIFARRLNSPLHGMLKVRDPSGRVVLDIADTEGRDFATTMLATAGMNYEISLHDLDFAGDRSYVYRLTVAAAPRVLAAYPAAGQRGQTRPVEFVGIGLATGSDKLESVTRDVAFPANADAATFDYSVQTEWGNAAPVKLLVSDVPETVKPATGESVLSAPGAVTGAIEQRFGSDQHSVALTKGQTWEIAAQARRLNSSLDMELTVFGPDGKQVATNDDAPGSTDAEISLTVPADGLYRIVVADRSGKSGSRAANYRLVVSAPREDLELSLPPLLNVLSGGQGKLALKATRKGGFKGAIPVTISGLPTGVTAPENQVIPEGKTDLAIDLTCAADAAVKSSLCSIRATVQIGGQMVTRTAGPTVISMTMKPRIKLTPEGLDDVRKVHRGSTYLFPMLIERLEGYTGPITLEMTAKQQRHRQGLASDDFIVPADARRVEYPIFVPEWMETTKTSRMILNGAVQIPDPQGNLRTLLQRQELRFGILPEGALMKLSHAPGEIKAAPGSTIKIPLSLSIASELKDPIEISIVPNDVNQGAFTGNLITLVPGQKSAIYEIQVSADAARKKEQEVTVRAKALKDGRWPVISETSLTIEIE
ncbi:MAG: PPC domain-containing protein [Planctomycetota bacterium]